MKPYLNASRALEPTPCGYGCSGYGVSAEGLPRSTPRIRARRRYRARLRGVAGISRGARSRSQRANAKRALLSTVMPPAPNASDL